MSAIERTQKEANQRAAEILHHVGGGDRVKHGRDGGIVSKDTIPPGNDPNPSRDKEHLIRTPKSCGRITLADQSYSASKPAGLVDHDPPATLPR